MKKERTQGYAEILFFLIFAIVGIGLFVRGVFDLISGVRFEETAKETTATITTITSDMTPGGDAEYNAYVDYQVEGKWYRDVCLHYYTSSMREGETITLLYDPENPENIRTREGDILSCVFLLGGGTGFSCVGIIPLIIKLKRKGKSLSFHKLY